jgi:hypothetical protein
MQRVATFRGRPAVFCQCPVCGREILCSTPKDGESISTKPYADHYEKEHR